MVVHTCQQQRGCTRLQNKTAQHFIAATRSTDHCQHTVRWSPVRTQDAPPSPLVYSATRIQPMSLLLPVLWTFETISSWTFKCLPHCSFKLLVRTLGWCWPWVRCLCRQHTVHLHRLSIPCKGWGEFQPQPAQCPAWFTLQVTHHSGVPLLPQGKDKIGTLSQCKKWPFHIFTFGSNYWAKLVATLCPEVRSF